MRIIREAKPTDLTDIMQVMEAAKKIMRQSGNLHQWADGYPSEAVIISDMEKHGGFVLEEAGRIVGYFAFLPSPEPTYSRIYNGKWLDDVQSYHVIHRIASYPDVHGIFNDIMDFCFSHDANIRIDTHKDNRIMQHNIEKHGFTYCGIIYLANGRSSESRQACLDGRVVTDEGEANGRSSESRQACLDGRVVTDEGEANSDERLAYQKLHKDSVFHQKSFQELTVDELYELLRVRSEVFVVEQNCVYQDMDNDDQKSIHLWLTVANKIVALARVCPAGTHMQEVSIGRVITTERGKGYGKQIMLHAIEAAKEHFDAKQIDIEAQKYAKGFYESVGFKQSSDTFMLDGIPHIRMTLRL